jgi:hypothetical protein
VHEDSRAESGSTVCNDHWLPGFNFNVEEWFEGHQYETLAICRSLSARMKLRHGLMVC